MDKEKQFYLIQAALKYNPQKHKYFNVAFTMIKK